MIPLSLAEVADVLDASLAGADDDTVRPAGVLRIDSRDVEPGDVFACVRGEGLDGHDFVDEALRRGALLSIAARTVPGPHVVVDDVVFSIGRLARASVDRRPDMKVVALTGSSGKTSTKDLLAHVLEQAGPTVSPPNSFNNEIGLPVTALRADDSTRFLVLEMGARGAGHIRDLCEVAPPHVGVVLNVGSAHLGEFGDQASVAQAKGELVECLGTDGTAVLNADDPAVVAMASRTSARALTFGLGDADVRASDVQLDRGARASFTLHAPDGERPVSLQSVGAHQVPNALAAAAAAHALGLPVDLVAEGLSGATPRSRWRMEVETAPGGLTVVNDAYNANPESVRAALEALARMADGRETWAVLGEMRELGKTSGEAHAEVGRGAAQLGIDRVVAVGDAAGVADGAAAAGMAGGRIARVADATEAAELIDREAAADAVVLVKASRAIGLERVAELLLAARGASAGAVPGAAGQGGAR